MVDQETVKQRVYRMLMDICGCNCQEALYALDAVKAKVIEKQKSLEKECAIQDKDSKPTDWERPKELSYRKKPIVIKAMKMPMRFTVKTMEGEMKGKEGDYLVTGIKGEQYPCDASIFEESYDLVG